jgi:iron complex outermembrane recepter protein
MKQRRRLRHGLLTGAVALTVAIGPAITTRASTGDEQSGDAQTEGVAKGNSGGSDSLQEVVVTARKRDESALSVPVVVTAISRDEMSVRAINSIDSLAQLVPGLITGSGNSSVQGGTLTLRGLTGLVANPFADQAVSFNIDGVQVANSSVRRLATMDMDQVEVLKGPQTLFFGKDSPGGVVALRTGDPTSGFTGEASLGYEFYADEIRGEGYAAGPITDDLGFRVAVYGSGMRGWFENMTPAGATTAPPPLYGPSNQEVAGRLTLKYAPTDSLTVRVKYAHDNLTTNAPQGDSQFIYCPFGAPQFGTVDDCRADKYNSKGIPGTAVAALDPNFLADGQAYGTVTQNLGGLEINYKLTDALLLTSVTGGFSDSSDPRDIYDASYIDSLALMSYIPYADREISEEIRLESSFSAPINFTTGVYYGNTNSSVGFHVFLGRNDPLSIIHFNASQKGESISPFAQLTWNILPELELAGGARYSYEHKYLPEVDVNPAAGSLAPPTPFPTPVTSQSWSNVSPEATLTWRPTQRLTLYGAYKTGFLSGGFNLNAPDFSFPIDYGQEIVKGEEAGIKAALLDNTLRLNLAFFHYNISGLQVSQNVNNVVTSVTNAASAYSKGVDFDVAYRVPLPGLTLHGAVSYLRANYEKYLAPCYDGQSIAAGCNAGSPVGGAYSDQKLDGQALQQAPTWSANAGFDYVHGTGSGLEIGLSSEAEYTSEYFTDGGNMLAGLSPSRTLVDATLRLMPSDESWELAIIGNNLTNRYYWDASNAVPFTGSGTGTALAVPPDVMASVSRGRQVMLRVMKRFGR